MLAQPLFLASSKAQSFRVRENIQSLYMNTGRCCTLCDAIGERRCVQMLPTDSVRGLRGGAE